MLNKSALIFIFVQYISLINAQVEQFTITVARQILADEEYTGMLAAIGKENFETGKLELAKTFFATQVVSAEQVLGVLQLMAFENNKLVFSEFAFSHTINKQNYYKILEAMPSEQSKKELTAYIEKQ